MAMDTRKSGYPVNFKSIPKIGTKVTWWGGHVGELFKVSPYERRDGTPSQILHWRFEDGRTGTTGIKAKGIYWDQKP